MAQDAGSIYSEVRIKLDRLSSDIKAVNTKFDQLGKNLQDSSNKTKNTLVNNFKAIGLAGPAAIGAITLAFKSAVRTFANTEQALANVRAVSNATEDEFRLLQDAAAEAGTTTRFTASQAADALFFLSSAGLSATQSVEALSGVLELAGATGSDLGQSAQAVTATLSQFGLAADKASDVANVFAAANSNSQATLEKLQNSLRQVGPIAGQFGVSLEETTASLQALFNAGFAGEQSGVALRNILLTLADSSSDAAKAFVAAGGSVDDVNPRFVGLTGALENLTGAGIDLSEVFDKRAVGAALVLGNTAQATEGNLRDLEAAVTGTSEATRQYAVQNDTLAGSLDALKSALEGTGNTYIGKIAPYIREVVDLTTDLTRFTGDLGKETESTGKKILRFANSFLNPIAAIRTLTVETNKWLLNLSRSRREAESLEQVRLDDLFKEIAESAGIADDGLDEFYKTAQGVEETLTEIFTSENATFDEVKNQVDLINQSFGISQEQIIQIGLKSDQVTEEYKEQLRLLEQQNSEQAGLSAEAQARIEGIRARGRAEQELARQREEEQRKLQEQQQEELRMQGEIAEIVRTIVSIRELETRGLISTEESLERQIEFRESLLDNYKNQAIADGELTDEIIENIRGQEYQLGLLYQQKDLLSEESTENVLSNQDAETQNFIKNQEDGFASYQDFLMQRSESEREALNERERMRAQEAEAEEAQRQESLERYNEYYSRIAGFATDLFSVLADLALKNAEIEIDAINQKLEADLSAIDQQTNAKLESLGLQEETKIEELNREIAEAKAAGDTELENEKQKELDRLLILNEADKQKAVLEEDAAKRTAQLQYEADLAAWKLEKAAALVSASQAILQGYAQLGPIGGSIAAAGTAIITGAQIALIDKNKPEPPALQTGGIVLPRSGGTLTNLAENGAPELALNAGAEGQELLGQFAQQISDKMGGKGANIILNIDGRAFAKYIADTYYSSGVVTIDGRAIR